MKAGFAFLAAFFASVILSAAGMKARNPNPRAGWKLVPVLVMATDLPEGSLVTMEQISQRSIPEQFMTSAYVTPDQASFIIDQPVNFPLLAGDPITWSAFADLTRRAAVQDCATAIKPAVDEVAASTLASLTEELRDGGAAQPEASPIPAPVPDADGNVAVVTAVRDLAPGVIGSTDVRVTKVPARFATKSWVPGSERPSVVGARLLVALQANDGVWWQMLDDPGHPATASGCADAVGRAQAVKMKDLADLQAKQWFERKAP